MISREFYQIIKNNTEDIEKGMYEYGFSCGKSKVLDFNKIKDTIKALDISDAEVTTYTRKIISGFCRGLHHRFAEGQ